LARIPRFCIDLYELSLLAASLRSPPQALTHFFVRFPEALAISLKARQHNRSDAKPQTQPADD